MNVIHGKENLDQIDDRYTALELETLLISKEKDPITNYAIIGPDSGLSSVMRLKQFIPVHEALIRNYKKKDWNFCLQAIEKLRGNIDPFMDTFYDILKGRIEEQAENPTKDWSHILDLT